MYIVRYYDGAWHERRFEHEDRARKVFNEKKNSGASRVELYTLVQKFDIWEDAFESIERAKSTVKAVLNRLYGDTARDFRSSYPADREEDTDHVRAD